MVRINKEKLGGAIKDLATTEPVNEETGSDHCSCHGNSCGIDKVCKDQNWQEDT